MAQYRVSFIALAESTIEVEADSPEEALDLANAEFDYPVTLAGDPYELHDWEARAEIEWLDTSSTPQQRLGEHVVKIED
ncbi:hypothetical protein H2C43_07230 [Corynebacterium glutamicum]|uniref:Uncharacterized protein n=1 Tax=Corynebacterium glutamicum (strain ATCC 13032 / DSM 20300 / JCM 1318 / BCRC 11384 / CCUG 27702 / LMG 3730 / NBRC 12168 / NCIMB 10025 / NRRL B-2784 / 534) TaxID=196627 RepID=Q8NPD5_CORGL|nr:hypothetical protein [Corynebacterium glutamicum]AUI01357.1 hypothetical protein CYL77_09490 [Corynebacterium glutamicum]AUI05005.1 hypothetical protein C0I99_13185 [Corynebacterium glutamicum]MBA4571800.1 hypothetical protein [Corynebacterium glutamicum]MBA4574735.1 hypothetical protein [Corynebacterium glutamicum]MBA4577664.1 hypothetical protein [Corynebacterium glutamicum]